MDLRMTKEDIDFRNEVREFFRTSLPKDIRDKSLKGQRHSPDDMRRWHCILDDKGWVAPGWATEWGGTGWNPMWQYIFFEERQKAPAPDPLPMNINLIGPVLIAFGTEEQKNFFLPKVRRLDYWFAQGFSEPGAGSDLAALKTRAVRDGDHYIVNGSKMWTSTAHHANWIFALVRTNPDAKKQAGISYLLMDIKTPGITVRPTMMLDGQYHTNEVFFDNVRVPVTNLVGEENKGWDYAKFLLGHERLYNARIGVSKSRVNRAWELARLVNDGGQPLAENPRFREKLVSLEIELKALEISNLRLASAMTKGHDTSGPLGTILNIRGSEIQQASTELLMNIAGPAIYPNQPELVRAENVEPVGPEWAATAAPNYFITRAATIYGGAGEIQRNIMAKSVLGLK
jgi:alkylation response protein AidB-like acyl-CoA dehydrogenase